MNQPTPPPYNLNPLLERFANTYRKLDDLVNEPKKRKKRKKFDDIAEALCTFFKELEADTGFWGWLATLANPTRDQIEAFLNGLNDFEDHQLQLLEGLGLDAMAAARLSTALTTSIEAYRPLLIGGEFDVGESVQRLTGYVEQIRGAVCVADPTLKNVSYGLTAMATVGGLVSGLGAAGGLAAAGGVLAAGSAAAFALPVVVCALGLGALVARMAHDRRNQ